MGRLAGVREVWDYSVRVVGEEVNRKGVQRYPPCIPAELHASCYRQAVTLKFGTDATASTEEAPLCSCHRHFYQWS